MASPYTNLPPERFWRTGVASHEWAQLPGLYRKKFEILEQDKIATAGSCFAQHIAVHMRREGFQVIDCEPPPPGLNHEKARRYGYGIYSARYGNIYVVRQLLQLIREASEEIVPAEKVWEKDGRYYDALRPAVEPGGFSTPDEVTAHRQRHLARVKKLLRDMNIFVFTFGLTEAWVHTGSGQVFPTCPGTIAGEFDAEKHAFKNFSFQEILDDFIACRDRIREFNATVRFLVTVSPVPLTATASQQHVLPATIYSKSLLRTVAGQLSDMFPDVDYFPSYEIIASPWSGGAFYGQNRRDVTEDGVSTVMRTFFSEHRGFKRKAGAAVISPEDLVCEEIVLDAFAP